MQYTESEINKMHRVFLINMIGFAFWLLLGAALTIYFIVTRNRTGAILSFVCCGIVSIFYWGIWGADVVRYERFMREIQTGLHNSFIGEVLSIGDVSIHDDLPMRQIRILEEDKEIERLCYCDIFKDDPEFQNLKAGDRRMFTVHAQTIIAVEDTKTDEES